MTATASPSRFLVLSALIMIQILFGVNYIASKIVVGTFPPMVWASIRIIISTVMMFGIAFVMKRPHPKGGRKYFLGLIPLALLGTIINQGSFLKGLSLTTSTNSAILNTLIPVFTLLIVTIRGQERLTVRRGIGFVSAFVGVLVVRKVEHFSLQDATLIGDLLTILNCLSYAFFLSYSKAFLSKHDPIWNTAWLFLYGSFGLSLLSLPDWASFHWPTPSPALWVAMAFAVFGATLMTYFLSFWALAHATSSQVALFIYLQPVITSLIAWIWMAEPVTVRTITATGLIFLGMLLGLSKKERTTSITAPNDGSGPHAHDSKRSGKAVA